MDSEKLNELLKGIWESLTDEQKEKAKGCKNLKELTALLGGMGVALPDELLDAVVGGLTIRGKQVVPTPRTKPIDDPPSH